MDHGKTRGRKRLVMSARSSCGQPRSCYLDDAIIDSEMYSMERNDKNTCVPLHGVSYRVQTNTCKG